VRATRASLGGLALAAGGAVAAALGAVAAAPVLPAETSARAERALGVLDRGFVGSYTVTVSSAVEKPGGKDRQESLRVVALSRGADGATENRIVRAIDNGKDVTEAERAKAATAAPGPSRTPTPAPGKAGAAKERESGYLRLPFGEDAKLYRVFGLVEEGGLAVAGYEPLPEHRKDDGVAKGRVAWRRDTLDPVWLEAELLSLPTGASRLAMRFEFAREGDVLYPKVVTTSGAGGILWIKRNFEARMEISDLRPAAPVSSD